MGATYDTIRGRPPPPLLYIRERNGEKRLKLQNVSRSLFLYNSGILLLY